MLHIQVNHGYPISTYYGCMLDTRSIDWMGRNESFTVVTVVFWYGIICVRPRSRHFLPGFWQIGHVSLTELEVSSTGSPEIWG